MRESASSRDPGSLAQNTDRGREFTARSFRRGCRRAGSSSASARSASTAASRSSSAASGRSRTKACGAGWRRSGGGASGGSCRSSPTGTTASARTPGWRVRRRRDLLRSVAGSMLPAFRAAGAMAARSRLCATAGAGPRAAGARLALEVRYLEGRARLPVAALSEGHGRPCDRENCIDCDPKSLAPYTGSGSSDGSGPRSPPARAGAALRRRCPRSTAPGAPA